MKFSEADEYRKIFEAITPDIVPCVPSTRVLWGEEIRPNYEGCYGQVDPKLWRFANDGFIPTCLMYPTRLSHSGRIVGKMCFFATAIHELAHIIEDPIRLMLAREGYKTTSPLDTSYLSKPRSAVASTPDEKRRRQQWVYCTHPPSFSRIAAHLCWRFRQAEPFVGRVLRYGDNGYLQPEAEAIEAMLLDEIKRRPRLDELDEIEPPEAFQQMAAQHEIDYSLFKLGLTDENDEHKNDTNTVSTGETENPNERQSTPS